MLKAILAAGIIAYSAMHSPDTATVDPSTDRNPSCGYTVTEDSTGQYPCGWDCATMGNGLCEAGRLGAVARRQ